LLTKRNQNDITLLNKFLLIIIFTKTCIKALYMRHNYCLTRQENHAVAGKPRDAAVNSDRYQQPVGQKQSE